LSGFVLRCWLYKTAGLDATDSFWGYCAELTDGEPENHGGYFCGDRAEPISVLKAKKGSVRESAKPIDQELVANQVGVVENPNNCNG
jgi:hypothetical protein